MTSFHFDILQLDSISFADGGVAQRETCGRGPCYTGRDYFLTIIHNQIKLHELNLIDSAARVVRKIVVENLSV